MTATLTPPPGNRMVTLRSLRFLLVTGGLAWLPASAEQLSSGPPTPVFAQPFGPPPNAAWQGYALVVPPTPMGATAEQIIEQVRRGAEERMGVVRPPSPAESSRQAALDAQRQAQLRSLYAEMREDLSKPRTTAGTDAAARACADHFGFADPASSASPEHARFVAGMQRLDAMLSGKVHASLADAVFAMEQPVLGAKADRTAFDLRLNKLVDLVHQHVKRAGGHGEDPLALHEGIQRLFTDTLVDRKTGRTFYPLRYDLDDFWGEQEPTKLLVTKLMDSGQGQCRSMPLLYLLLAERLGIDAYWAFSPNHSYVKYPGRTGAFENFETTVGMKSSDQWLMRSGYIRSGALQHGIYLDTVGTHRSIAHLMVELLQSTEQRFGTDQAFAERTLRTALEHYPTDIHAMLQLRNLRIQSAQLLACTLGKPSREQLTDHPELAAAVKEIDRLTTLIDGLGFAEMPAEAYADWLVSLEREREKRTREVPSLPAGNKGLEK